GPATAPHGSQLYRHLPRASPLHLQPDRADALPVRRALLDLFPAPSRSTIAPWPRKTPAAFSPIKSRVLIGSGEPGVQAATAKLAGLTSWFFVARHRQR